MSHPHVFRLTPFAIIGAAFLAAILLCSPAFVGASENEGADSDTTPPPPTQLTTFLMDVSDEASDSEEEADAGAEDGDDGPAEEEPFEVIQSSLIVLDPNALDAINPHITADVEQMPIVRMELMSDLVIDVEFLNAKPRWTFAAAENENEEAAGGGGIVPVEDGFLIRGTILPPHSGYVVLRARDAGVFGSVNVNGVGRFELWRAGEPFHTVNMLEYSELICEVEDQIAEEAMGMMGGNAAMGGEGSGSMPTGCPGGCDDGCTIDVMVLYTQSAENYWAGRSRDIRDEIETRICDVNGTFENSEIMPMGENLLRLVYVGLLHDDQGNPYDESGKSCENVIDDLKSLHGVAHIRDTIRADLVSVWTQGGGGVCANIPRVISLTKERDSAFSNVTAASGAQSSAHEFGHNLGCHHDRFEICDYCIPNHTCYDVCAGPPPYGEHCEDFCANPPLCESGCQCFQGTTECLTPCDSECLCEPNTYYNFSVGWHFDVPSGQGSDKYRTIMAYPAHCCHDAERIDYFSNPEVLVKGVPTGNACDDPEECCAEEVAPANNALTIGGDSDHYGFRFLLAQYRSSHDTTDTTEMLRARVDELPDFPYVVLNADSSSPSISSDGRYLLISSVADNIPGYTFPQPSNTQVIHYDRETSITKLVSVDGGSSGAAADGDSFRPAISGDGTTPVFVSDATNLSSPFDPVLSGGEQHVWARKPIDVVSRANGEEGEPGNGPSDFPAVSHDGRHVAFYSEATNLLGSGGDTNNSPDIFVRDRETLTTVRVSVSTNGDEANDESVLPEISETGRFVTFASTATNLAPGDTFGYFNIFLRDRDLNGNGVFDEGEEVWTFRISRAWDHPTNAPNNHSVNHGISGDGRSVVFQSSATNLLDPLEWTIHSLSQNIFLHDRDTGTTHLVTKHWDETTYPNESAIGDSVLPSISADGKWIVFTSDSDELHEDHWTVGHRIYIYSIDDDEIVQVIDETEVSDYEPAPSRPVISGDGRFIAADFWSTGSDPDQVFLHDRGRLNIYDLNGDGCVDDTDRQIVLLHMGYDCSVADVNGDGIVDQDDLNELMANWEPCEE